MLFYLDECYNTGNNWLDGEQPFFTYGGWLINEENLDKAKSIVVDFQKKHQGELKSKSFTSHKGIREITNLLKGITTNCNVKPYFICFEKKYMIACKIVELFFDHYTNRKVNGYLTYPNQYMYFKFVIEKNAEKEGLELSYEETKKYLPPIFETKNGLAEIISENVELCNYVGKIIDHKITDVECVQKILNDLNLHFKKYDLHNIADIFAVENFELLDIYNELIGTIIQNTNTPQSILVKPSLYEMILNLKSRFSDLKLIVDTIGKQNLQFVEISQLLNVPISIKEDSENDEMIMCSDLLVGYLARITNNIICEKDVTEKDIELLKEIFKPTQSSFDNNISMWNFKFSQKNWSKLQSKINIDVQEFDYINLLKNHFDIFLEK